MSRVALSSRWPETPEPACGPAPGRSLDMASTTAMTQLDLGLPESSPAFTEWLLWHPRYAAPGETQEQFYARVSDGSSVTFEQVTAMLEVLEQFNTSAAEDLAKREAKNFEDRERAA
jgi:hypothetical protein